MSEESLVLESLLHRRHSCRAFRENQVPTATIERMFAMAGRAASWCNAQPWRVIVTAGDATERFRQALSTEVSKAAGSYDIPPPAEYRGVYRDRRRACGFALYNSLGIARDDKLRRVAQAMENYRFFGAPHAAIITSPAELGPYGYVDCGGYIATLLLAAESLGLGIIAQAAIANYSNVVREHFAIPADRHVVCGLSFGYPDREHPANGFRTERAELDESLHFVTD
ncbi:nitroreductase [Nocardia cerradoensis]|nr:nitroreductase [Nocardia cerradoensis]NKY43630.1 nitroreductase [Nocardia cerradoensis]